MAAPSSISTLRRVALTSAAALALASPTPAHAQPIVPESSSAAPPAANAVPEPPATPTERGVLEAFVNGQRAGSWIVVFDDAELWVSADDLREAGLARVVATAATQTHDGVAHVSLADEPGGLTHVLDEESVSLRIHAPPSAFGGSTIDLQRGPPEGMRYVSHPSLFLNYAPTIDVLAERLEGFGELGFSHEGTLALTTVSHGPDRGLVRLVSQVVIDDRESLRRTTFGDVVASSGPLGGGAMLGGVSIASHLDLDPYLVRVPTLGFGGAVAAPSTLDVYVNDRLVRSEPLAPGQFRVQNLSPVTGAGSTRYVIRDPFGGQREVQSPYYATRGVLAPGLSDYAYTIGLRREGYGVESFGYGAPAVLGRHRYGFSEEVTAGARLEVDPTQASGGLNVTIAPGLGELEIAAAASATWEGRAGAAGMFAYRYIGRPLSIATTFRAASPEYTNVSLGVDDDRSVFEHATTATLAIDHVVSIAARGVYAFARDTSEPEVALGLDVTGRLAPEVSLRLSWTCRYDRSSRWEQALMGVLRVALPDRHSVSGGTHLTTEGGVVNHAQVSRPIHGWTGVGYRLDGALGTTSRVAGHLRAQSGHGTVDLRYANVDGQQQLLLRGGLGVAIVPDEGVFIRDPLSQSSTVVRIPGAPGVRTYLNNQEVGRTDGQGRIFVPRLLPYQANRLRVESSDLPLNYQLEESEHVIAPPFRGTSRVTFAGRRVQFVRGRVAMGADAAASEARYGQLEVQGGPEGSGSESWTSPLGMNGEFEVDGLPSGEWNATVRSARGSCDLTLDVPESDELFLDVGTVHCSTITTEAAP